MKVNRDLQRLFVLAVLQLCLVLVVALTPAYAAMVCCTSTGGPCLSFVGFDYSSCGSFWQGDFKYIYCEGYFAGEWFYYPMSCGYQGRMV